MPIHFTCNCGKKLTVADDRAGKRAKCPKCGAVSAVPQADTGGVEPVEYEIEVVDDVPSPASSAAKAPAKAPARGAAKVDAVEEVVEVEVAEEEPARSSGVRAGVAKDKAAKGKNKNRDSDEDDGDGKRRKKKKKGQYSTDSFTQSYFEQAKRDQELREKRGRGTGRDEGAEGLTIGGVHISGVVLGGAGLLLLGLIGMIVVGIFRELVGMRVFVGALVCTALGAITLISAVVYGHEE